jgi:hypothetical protein
LGHVEPHVEHEGINNHSRRQAMGKDSTAVIGMDVHKESVDIAMQMGRRRGCLGAWAGRPRRWIGR